MIFQLEALFFLFSLISSIHVLAAPVALVPSTAHLLPRVFGPSFTFSGDLASFPIPPAGSDKDSIKKNKKALAQQASREQQQQVAESRVRSVLESARASLGLSDNLAVNIVNNFHTSKSDTEKHITFNFNAPACKGTCVGHAYNPISSISPGKGQPGKIFNATTATIFGGQDK
ncbi:hypothetical protein ONZ45_g4599 [Pleurotus djamor]|nr:hypothetical protein ONZ45_g4599 [Pleurotus djamor]